MTTPDIQHFRRADGTLVPVAVPVPLTKREQFAMACLQGLLSDHITVVAFLDVAKTRRTGVQDEAARTAVQYADALLLELEKPREQ